ncbi:MAG: hypothetical protein K0R39_329 [Symbiobacteriaceae bacterium]|nr:hypothetical protein [Symbiobacteriaceae bacterium]
MLFIAATRGHTRSDAAGNRRPASDAGRGSAAKKAPPRRCEGWFPPTNTRDRCQNATIGGRFSLVRGSRFVSQRAAASRVEPRRNTRGERSTPVREARQAVWGKVWQGLAGRVGAANGLSFRGEPLRNVARFFISLRNGAKFCVSLRAAATRFLSNRCGREGSRRLVDGRRLLLSRLLTDTGLYHQAWQYACQGFLKGIDILLHRVIFLRTIHCRIIQTAAVTIQEGHNLVR